MTRKLIVEIICSLLIFLFTYTALSKLNTYSFFKAQLTLYPLLSNFSSFLTWFLPLAELSVAILLFIPKTRLYGLCCAAVILTIFTIYLLIMVTTKPSLPCTCGGFLQSMSWKQHIIFNTVFVILSFVGIISILKDKHWSKSLLQ